MTHDDLIDRLALGFDAPHSEVARIVSDSETLLTGVDNASAVEQFASERLEALTAQAKSPGVLFLCVHNAGRSQMARAWTHHLATGRVRVYSGGSDPAAEINAVAVEAMAEVGIDIRTQFPKPWTDEILRGVDVVVTMGCGDTCPVYPGTRYIDWELNDPHGADLETVRAVRDEIEQRVRGLLVDLEVEPRDR